MPYFSVGIEIISYIVFFPILPPLPHHHNPTQNSKRLSQFVTKENKPITTALTFQAMYMQFVFRCYYGRELLMGFY